jgi:DNA topoisomerase-1
VTVPDDLPPDELTADKVQELIERAANGSRPLGHDPDSGKPVYLKNGRYGPYVQLGDPELDDKGKVKRGGKAKMASLLPEMAPESVTLDDALRLLSFPRELGVHPETGEAVTAQYGRFGPFLRMGEENRSLSSYEQLDSVTLEQAVELFRQPKGQRRSRSAAVLAELGKHPGSGASVVVKTGRYGPYVTDGTVNATIPRGTQPDSVTLEQAVELLTAREDKIRAQGEDPRATKPKRGGRRKKRKR